MKNNQSFSISGMHCASCASNIQRKLQKEPGILEARVNYANELAFVTFDDSQTSQQKVMNVVTSLGYTPQSGEHAEQELEHHHHTHYKSMKQKLVVGLTATAVLMIGSMIPGVPAFLRHPILQMILATIVQFWVGSDFLKGAWSALKNKTASMDTLVSLGTLIAYVYSMAMVFFQSWIAQYMKDTHTYFETSAAIISFVLLGKFIEFRAKGKTSEALQSLMKRQVKEATRIVGEKEERVSIQALRVGDILRVKPGETVPIDGVLVSGITSIDESMISGESVPVEKTVDARVVGGTTNTNGAFTMRVTKVGQDTLLSHIVAMVRQAQGTTAPIQRVADQVSAVFVPIVLILSLITFVGWIVFGPEPKPLHALLHALSVLVIACPCALGLATPTSFIVGIGKGAQLGIFVRNAVALEEATRTTHVVFDKTGTLTIGKPTVQQSTFSSQDTILPLIYSVEKQSHHPFAHAIVQWIEEHSVHLQASSLIVDHMKDISGFGVTAIVQDGKMNKTVFIGTEKLFDEQKISIRNDIASQTTTWKTAGMSVAHVAVDKKHIGAFAFADTIRTTAKNTIQRLHAMGLKTVMLTGDHEGPAQLIAQAAGVQIVRSEYTPQQKQEYLRELKKDPRVHVAMVGDGINDAPALALADTSIAMGEGTDVAQQSASITLLHSDISRVPTVFLLSKKTMINVKQNLFWAFAYNIALIPIAMGVLVPFFGIEIQPMYAGAAMAFSSVSVVLNALRLKAAKIT